MQNKHCDRNFYRTVLMIAIPIVIQNLISIGLNMADTIMIGKVGVDELAAVGTANRLYFIFPRCVLEFTAVQQSMFLNTGACGISRIFAAHLVSIFCWEQECHFSLQRWHSFCTTDSVSVYKRCPSNRTWRSVSENCSDFLFLHLHVVCN